MNYVEPIRDPNLIKDILNYLKSNNDRNYLLFCTGIYQGLRISDILKLRSRDVYNKTSLNIWEKKTGKRCFIEINPALKKEFTRYIQQHDLDPDDYLFTSRQGANKPIGRSMAYKILRDVGEMFNLEAIGTHTLRKTFGYHFYKQTGDVATLMQIFNHSSPSITMRYIGITQESINNSMKKFKYF